MRFKLLGALLLIAVLAGLALREFAQERAGRDRVDPSRESRRSAVPDEPRVEPEMAKEAPPEETIRVRVVGPRDRPLQGVVVRTRNDQRARTGADGWARLRNEPELDQVQESLTDAWHRLRGAETVIRLPNLLPLRVEYVDARTGLPLQGGAPRLVTRLGGVVAPDEDGAVRVPAAAGPTPRTWRLWLVPPEGKTGPQGLFETARSCVSVRAERLLLPVALVDEQPISVRVVAPDGTPVAGAGVAAGFAVQCNATDADGSTVVRGVPHRPGSPLHLTAYTDRLRGSVDLAMSDVPAPIRVTIELDQRALMGSKYESTSEFDYDEAFEEPLPPETRLEVAVQLRSGQPFANGWILLLGPWDDYHRLDSEGSATLVHLVPGRYRLAAIDPAFAPRFRSIDLQEGRPERIELIESTVWTAEVRVRNLDGSPVPAATVYAGYHICPGPAPAFLWQHARVEAGEQHLRRLTGPGGRVTLSHLPQEVVNLVVKAPDGRTASFDLHPERNSLEPVVITLR
jgi:hypothetical protein